MLGIYLKDNKYNKGYKNKNSRYYCKTTNDNRLFTNSSFGEFVMAEDITSVYEKYKKTEVKPFSSIYVFDLKEDKIVNIESVISNQSGDK